MTKSYSFLSLKFYRCVTPLIILQYCMHHNLEFQNKLMFENKECPPGNFYPFFNSSSNEKVIIIIKKCFFSLLLRFFLWFVLSSWISENKMYELYESDIKSEKKFARKEWIIFSHLRKCYLTISLRTFLRSYLYFVSVKRRDNAKNFMLL